jgi:hypothetical protein
MAANRLKSVGAVVAGIVVGAGLSIATDAVMHATGVFPKSGGAMSNSLFAIALGYRIIYGILGSYVIARLAPDRPMFHAMIGGLLGLVVSTIGVIATWNRVAEFGPHWYPLSLVVTALPTAWLGARLRLMQLKKHSAAAA